MLNSSIVRLKLVLPVLTISGVASAFPPTHRQSGTEQKRPSLIEAPIVPGEGFGGVLYGDSAADVERVLGEAKSGSDTARSYSEQGFEVRLYKDRVHWFKFYRGFRGRLADSGLGIGSTLREVELAYGSVNSRRKVDEVWGWSLHRVLLVRRGGPASATGLFSRLHYQDQGLVFSFDKDYTVIGMSLGPKRAVAKKRVVARDGQAAGPAAPAPAWYVREAIREGEGFAGIRFGDSPDRVEEVLGDAAGGGDTYRSFGNPEVYAFFRNGQLFSLRFGRDFQGRLSESDIGIGQDLDDIVRAYGEPVAWREVDRLSDWNLDRTVVTQKGATPGGARAVSKLLYRASGVQFLLNENDEVISIQLFRPQPAVPAKKKPGKSGGS